jgi:hypothetical protein
VAAVLIADRPCRADVCFEESNFDVEGVGGRSGGEELLVRGVRLLIFPSADKVEGCAAELKTEDTVLAWELADPTPLSNESLSSTPCGPETASVM